MDEYIPEDRYFPGRPHMFKGGLTRAQISAEKKVLVEPFRKKNVQFMFIKMVQLRAFFQR